MSNVQFDSAPYMISTSLQSWETVSHHSLHSSCPHKVDGDQDTMSDLPSHTDAQETGHIDSETPLDLLLNAISSPGEAGVVDVNNDVVEDLLRRFGGDVEDGVVLDLVEKALADDRVDAIHLRSLAGGGLGVSDDLVVVGDGFV